MAADRLVPADQVPEADLLEQQPPLDRPDLTNGGPDILDSPEQGAEADPWKQAVAVPGGAEDDYPHDGVEKVRDD